MTEQQKKDKLVKFYKTNKKMPSYREMAALFNFNSKNAVFKLVKKWVKEEFVCQDDQGRLIPNKLIQLVKILGYVEAGFPAPAEEQLLNTISLDDYLVARRDESYLLKVKGDSMKGAGIIEGDLVLVEKTNRAKPGDIVIAAVDGDWTIKYLRQKNGTAFLEPANPRFKPIFPKQNLTVAAVVRAVVRKYS